MINLASRQVYSDFVIEKLPTTLKEAFETFKNISSNEGTLENSYKYASPMTLELTPLKLVGKL